jgi:hypothetical protein
MGAETREIQRSLRILSEDTVNIWLQADILNYMCIDGYDWQN